MRKLAAWILVICLLFAAAACGDKTQPANAGETAAEQTAAPEKDPEQTGETGAQPTEEPAATPEPEEEPTEEPEVPAAAVEPYGDSDGVIDRTTLAALRHWIDSMQSEFRYALTFDQIGAAAGKAGCDMQNGDGKYHAAYWTDGDKGFVTVTFREKDGDWTCGSVSYSGLTSEEAEQADISAFPKLGSSAPAGTNPVKSVTLDNKCSGKVINVTADIPEKGWFAFKGSFDLRYYCAPNEKKAKDSFSYILIEFSESEDTVNQYTDRYENLGELPTRVIGGIGMTGRTFRMYGMDWTEYYGKIEDDVWVSIRLTGVDLSAGTETDALVNSLTFAVQ